MKTRTHSKNLAGVAIAVSILVVVTGCIDSAVGPALEHALSLAPQFVQRQETVPAEPIPAGAIEIATIDQLQQIGKNAAYPRDGHYVLTHLPQHGLLCCGFLALRHT